MAKEKIKEIHRNHQGITLIALVITIIVLLILAGVAIATLTGDNGIIQNAKVAKTSTEEKQAEEEAMMIYNEYEMYKKMCEVNGEEVNIEEFLTNRGYNYEKKEDEIYEITTDSGNKVKIDSNGNLMVNDKVVAVIKAENIQISGAKTVKKGQTAEIMATINPGDSIYRGIEWESKDTSKVEVEGNGKECTVRGVEAGKVVIRCKIKNYDNTETIEEYEIEVLDYNVKTVTISGTSSVETEKTVTLTVAMDADTSEYSKIEWSSSDVATATVSGNDKTCVVTGKKAGSVIITCKVTNYDGTIISGTYGITVKSATLIILNGANTYASITGGWTAKKSCSHSYCTVSTENAFMSIGYLGEYASVCTNNKIDVTNYNKMYFDYEITNNSSASTICYYSIGITSDKENNDNFSKKYATTAEGKGTKYVDISSYTGSYYIKLYTQHSTSVTWDNYYAYTRKIYLTN